MSSPRYLTKSRFKLARECPTKLFYTNKKDTYADQKLDDPFLMALADGGFQVGELAKHYFPGGVEIGRPTNNNYEEPVHKTRDLLLSGDVIIYEAAFQADNFFIYADIVVKTGNLLELYEVKAKSFNPLDDAFLTRNGMLSSKWAQYVEDVAFQKMVIQKAFPEFEVRAHLTLANKESKCPTDGLNQKFRVRRTDRNSFVIVSDRLTNDDLKKQILISVNVDEICSGIYDGSVYSDAENTLEASAYYYAELYLLDKKASPAPSRTCRKCEFRASHADIAAGRRSGYEECWTSHFNMQPEDLASMNLLNIWNLHYRTTDRLLGEGRVRITDITDNDIRNTTDGRPGLSQGQRQWLQVSKAQNNDASFWLDTEGLKAEMENWNFPLHFIDFETSMPAIPFNKGRRPYEGIAFQFSHHTVQKDGTVEHKNEFLCAEPGIFPSFDLVRSLKSAVGSDNGTIFRYADHENSYLCMILDQLERVVEPIQDKEELIGFIRSISHSVSVSAETWLGDRDMVDLCRLVKRYYYDPLTGGSNSIKKVLPAIIARSKFLQDKYSKPIYGSVSGIKSLNYNEKIWVQIDDSGVITDPYDLLPKMFVDIDSEDLDELFSDTDELKDGGAALTAYAKLQFQEMTAYERTEIEKALLKYCELDTLAMVMLYEGWIDLINN